MCFIHNYHIHQSFLLFFYQYKQILSLFQDKINNFLLFQYNFITTRSYNYIPLNNNQLLLHIPNLPEWPKQLTIDLYAYLQQ